MSIFIIPRKDKETKTNQHFQELQEFKNDTGSQQVLWGLLGIWYGLFESQEILIPITCRKNKRNLGAVVSPRAVLESPGKLLKCQPSAHTESQLNNHSSGEALGAAFL
jgi:hypothetical protein